FSRQESEMRRIMSLTRAPLVAFVALASLTVVSSADPPAVPKTESPALTDLPTGAVRRLGTPVLRQGSPLKGLVVTPDGQHAVALDGQGFDAWNLQSGQHVGPAAVMPPGPKKAKPTLPVASPTLSLSSLGALTCSTDGKFIA